jgi:hypothetical protein
MNTMKKTKLCWNCEGVVDRSAENCIYCGVYLHPEEEDLDDQEDEEESHPSLYQQQESLEESDEEQKQAYSGEEYKIEDLESEEAFKGSEDIRGVILPLIFLLAGSVFLLFSVVLYFFSQDGVFVLKWNANYWFIYLFFSIPLLYIGWRTLQYFEERGN